VVSTKITTFLGNVEIIVLFILIFSNNLMPFLACFCKKKTAGYTDWSVVRLFDDFIFLVDVWQFGGQFSLV
jgi:hypothetical protein